MMHVRVGCLVVTLLLAGPVLGQGENASPPAPERGRTLKPLPSSDARRRAPSDTADLWKEWKIRLSGGMGGGYVGYEETLTDVKSDFGSGAFAMRVGLEGNIHGFSPYMRLATEITGGEETARVMNFRQKDDLSLVTFLMDIGAGYRIDLNQTVTLVPSAAYTLDLMAFDREKFEIDGTRVTLVDLDGKPLESVGEGILGHGLSGRLGLEVRPVEALEIHLHGVFTWLPLVTVDNDIGGEVDTEGYSVRGGVGVTFWITPRLGVGGEVEFLFRQLDKSDIEFVSGSFATASVQFPDSETLVTVATVGVTARF
jgi:hypothetical protein